MADPLNQAKELLRTVEGVSLTREQRVEKSIELASFLLQEAIQEKSHAEKKQEAWLARMMNDPQGRSFTTQMTDQVFRSHSAKKTADLLVYLLKKYGIPSFLSPWDRFRFTLFKWFGKRFPDFLMALIRGQITEETKQVLLPEDPKDQASFFKQAHKENIRLNINHLGEAILGEQEAMRRLKVYLEDLANPDIEYVSVKISTIFSQINMVGYDDNLRTLSERLKLLYDAAKAHPFRLPNGHQVSKFVNLDMEEYKDLALTVDLFKKVLSQPDQWKTPAGIVLQSYLPDTFPILVDLTEWAIERKQKGGGPIKIRLVKGANMSMESVESSVKGWELATYDHKAETDAHFKQMLEYACQPEHAEAVHIGVGSHNLFEIAYAFILRSEHRTEPFITFEMLEGMANPLRRVVQKLAGGILLYCPEAKRKDFHTAVAYLIRRLDENSGPENFLRHFYELQPGNATWRQETERFKEASKKIDSLSHAKKRKQNRFLPAIPPSDTESFKNEADTDFSLPENRKWASQIFEKWEKRTFTQIPLVIGGKEIQTEQVGEGVDPSKPHQVYYRYSLADITHVDSALVAASQYQQQWASLPFDQRSHLLGKVAGQLKKQREDLIGAMIADTGKTVSEADPEVSEAIDFIDYYRKNWSKQLAMGDLGWKPKGTVLVAPPWNFPCSIPVNGIAAALTTGNIVIFKPAPESVLVGWQLVQAFWEAGIPKEALHFINCPDEPVGSYLIKHPSISSVILTGSTQTALHFMHLRPGIDLHAETGGKNAIIATALCDRDLAVRDIVLSAFGHAGQKCSACSLAILEAEIYDDPDFKRQLLDAASSLKVATAWNPTAKITPLIRPPMGPLLRGLTTLEPGESWLLQPKADPKNPHLWSPGIKWGVSENSFTHQTELFGPVLGVMRAASLDEAIRLANGTPYGLTSGLHSLDPREQEKWKEKIVAGNLYINRGITGAIVRRQPFGGCKASSFGSGAKAGGPNYVHQLARPLQREMPHEKASLPPALLPLLPKIKTLDLSPKACEIWQGSAENYAYWAPILKEPTDPSSLYGQDNYFYLIPLSKASVRYERPENLLSLLQVVAACLACGTPLDISTAIPLPLNEIPGITVTQEEELDLFSRNPSRIRLLTKPSFALQSRAAEKGTILLDSPVLANGRIELLHYLREVALSIDTHRYGFIPKT